MTCLREQLPYRLCVGIMVLNDDNKVWIGKRIARNQTQYEQSQKRWQMPQGGIKKNENPVLASLRELYEETGIHNVGLITQTNDWLTYDLPNHLIGYSLRGKYRGQKQKWFVYRFKGNENEIRIKPITQDYYAEFETWCWEEMNKLPTLIVDFKRPLYEDLITRFSYLSKQ
ncbi:RNA pyrophosphohydrolase [Candidatus Endowatersipora endosymbiont of Watersipora subatra]|uniref:RNA pyrophosphohydrolase n=1 Tax=Candidatus Endowatersipora endosymbiont of Watersipora subatra TaxID=3077946 RepID=UPI00312C94F9